MPNKPVKLLSRQERSAHIETMEREEFDLLIVGGGVNGCWMALDATLRGLKVAMIEACDFGHGPSRNNSELLHGGFRYLKEWYQDPHNWHKVRSVLHLVRDALRERETLMRVAPHLARPVPFVMPLYAPKALAIAKRLFYRFGFWMYDLLSQAQLIKAHEMLSVSEAQQKLTGIETDGLVGAGLYYDCKMEPSRFIAEILKAAHAQGAVFANYLKATAPLRQGDDVTGFTCEDVLNKKTVTVRAKKIIDATGPWGDQFRAMIFPNEKPKLRLSKGVHIMVKQLFTEKVACAFFAPDDGRIIFVIPWGEEGNFSLIGTTDTDFQKSPDDVGPDQKSLDYLLQKVRMLFPKADLQGVGYYAGLRPLIRQEGGSASSVSREHQIICNGNTRVFSVFGGKWTTARVVAGEVIDVMFPEFKGQSRTADMRFGGEETKNLVKDGRAVPSQALLEAAKEAQISESILNHLILAYGEEAQALITLSTQNPTWKERIVAEFPFIKAEVIYAMRFEMAMCLSDFLVRRSVLGRLRDRGIAAAPIVAKLMAEELSWDSARIAQEIATYTDTTRVFAV